MKSLLTGLAIAGSMLFIDRALMAQQLSERADRKVTGQYYLPHSASAYQRAAMEHARALNYYGQNYQAAPQEITQQHLSEIKRNVAASKKELAKLKPEAAKDKSLQKPLAAIEEHLANCDEYCRMLTDEAGKSDGSDGKVIGDCCERIANELQAAEVENDKIKQHLGVGKKAK